MLRAGIHLPVSCWRLHRVAHLFARRTRCGENRTGARRAPRAWGQREKPQSDLYASRAYALELLSPVSNTLDTLDIYHFDLYRFTHPEEWTEAGFQEYLAARALCLIEWPERAGGLLGAPDLALMLEVEGDGRRLT